MGIEALILREVSESRGGYRPEEVRSLMREAYEKGVKDMRIEIVEPRSTVGGAVMPGDEFTDQVRSSQIIEMK